MTKVITVFNQKGGVGKTTSTINLACALGLRRKKILIIDMDPQANATSGLGIERHREDNIYDFLIDKKNVTVKSEEKNVWILPSGLELAGIEIELAQMDKWQFLLKDNLETIKDEFDYIFIDCPPSLGVLSIIALSASDSIIIPVQCEYYALEGVGQLMSTINLIKNNFNKDLEIEGVLLCMFDGRNNLALDVRAEVEKFFDKKVYQTLIPRNVRLAEAPSFGMSVLRYDSPSKGAKAYKNLAKEFLRKEKKRD
ncbi:ParA family protein [Peptoniphilus sp. GNH]|nr:ParA family protein [Peptoniphilus sp. GNH]